MVIQIKNLRKEKPKHPWQVKVCRSSPLGNPFPLEDEKFRDYVCDEYARWFWNECKEITDEDFHKELHSLAYKLSKYGKLDLFCWCAPKRCHAKTIKEYLENI